MEETASGHRADPFLDEIIAWTDRQPDILALVLTGSRARPDDAVDDFADWDVEVFTGDPAKYTDDSSWMAEIAPAWVFLSLTSHARGCPTRLVIFQSGRKVDFSILPAQALEAMASSLVLDELYERGYRVLIDKTGLAGKLPAPSYRAQVRGLPSEAEFRAVIDEFWFEAYHIPKYLQRGELWVVKHRDWTMKQMLLRMLEWEASASGQDVWDIGLRMRDWATPEAWDMLQEAFGRFDAQDSRRAFHATMALFRRTTKEVAEALGYRHPDELDEEISRYVASFE